MHNYGSLTKLGAPKLALFSNDVFNMPKANLFKGVFLG